MLLLILLSRMMLPREVTIIPRYLLFNRLGWLDTYWPLIVPHWLAGSSFGVLLPLAKPALASLAIFAFIGRRSEGVGSARARRASGPSRDERTRA